MAQNLVESIFNSKNNLNDFYPSAPGVKNFDIQRKHLFYGRIDKDGDATLLEDSNLSSIYAGKAGTQFAVDFVATAFRDLRINIRKAGNANFINRDGLFSPKLRAHKAWNHDNYRTYLDNMYTNFVNEYLSVNARYEKIKNFKDFVREFLRYSLRLAKSFPVTRTGFLTSVHCSPYMSGLMINIAPERFGLQSNARVLKYINDPNFFFFINEVKKFGFMVDKNAPWRMVFNLASGMLDKKSGGITGAQKYMNRKGVGYENIFETYYRKAYLDELISLENKLMELYTAYYIQYSTYESVQYLTDSTGRCYDVVVKNTRKDREEPPDNTGQEPEYWLKVLLKLRMAETDFIHTPENFDSYVLEMIKRKRMFGEIAALKYLNDLTRGFHVTKFNTKGAYWQGISHDEHEKRRSEARRHADNPSLVDYSITGTKNIQ
jgi:hypothetical protein